jgi:hypothetical protein
VSPDDCCSVDTKQKLESPEISPFWQLLFVQTSDVFEADRDARGLEDAAADAVDHDRLVGCPNACECGSQTTR